MATIAASLPSTSCADSSLARSIASLPPARRAALLAGLGERDLRALWHHWPFWARPNQSAPDGDWTTWLIMAGRGFGKTRCGAEWVRSRVEGPTPLTAPTGGARRIAFVAQTAADARDVMVEGETGILALSPPGFRPLYEPSKRRLTWRNGATAALFSAAEPDQLRGPQHHVAWSDELAKWGLTAQSTWDNLQLGLRLGLRPRQVVTTTPRPLPLLKSILHAPDTVWTRGSTFDNEAHLPPAFVAHVRRLYEGRHLGRQELEGVIVEDVEGALWTQAHIEAARFAAVPPDWDEVVVGVDPALTSGPDSDETGIVVAARGVDGHYYVLDDRSCRMSPNGWALRAVIACQAYKARRIVAEINSGGEMVTQLIRGIDKTVDVKPMHAKEGKRLRAEPVHAAYERGEVHHVAVFAELEDQMLRFVPKGCDFSPDRLDALVWALTALMPRHDSEPRIRSFV